MRQVFQTKFGGPDVPVEEQGDCMQAALATLLGIPLQEAFDFRRATAEQKRPTGWWTAFIEWCHERGWHPLILTAPLPGVLGMAGVQSHRLFNADGRPLGHQVVVRGTEVVHDPGAPFGEERYEIDRGEDGTEAPEYWYLVPFDPVPGDPLPALPHHPRIAPPDLIASTARPAGAEEVKP